MFLVPRRRKHREEAVVGEAEPGAVARDPEKKTKSFIKLEACVACFTR